MRTLMLAFVAVTPAIAQQTWVVDAANGAGTHFVDLPAAVAAAAPGDTLLVRAGSYTPPSINKALAIVGGPGVTVQGAFFLPYPNLVRNLPAGGELLVSQVSFQFTAPVELGNCAGRIVFDRCTLRSTMLTMTDCADLHWQQSVWDRTRAAVTRSRLTVTSCSFFTETFFEELNLVDATLECANTQIWTTSIVSNPAIAATRSNLIVRGGASAAVSGNTMAIRLNASTLRIDPSVSLSPAIGAISGSGATVAAMPSLTAASAPLGGTLTATLQSSPGNVVFSALALPSAPVTVVGIGTLWLDGPSLMNTLVAVQGTTGQLADPVPVPNNPVFAGVRLTRQFLDVSATGAFQLSNPVQLRID